MRCLCLAIALLPAVSIADEAEKLREAARKLGEEIGKALVERMLDPAAKGNDLAATDPKGDVVVVGFQRTSKDERAYVLRKYHSSDGKKMWERTFPESESRNWRPQAIVVAENAYFIAAAVNDAGGKDNWLVTRFNAVDGEKVWDREYDGPARGFDEPTAMAMTKDGDLLIAGVSSEADESGSFLIARYSSARGEPVWEHRIPGGECCGPAVKGMVVDSRGDLFITGQIGSEEPRKDTDIVTMKYAPDGHQKWMTVHDGGDESCDFSEALAPHPEGGVIVLGRTCENLLTGGVSLIRYSDQGDITWKRTLTEGELPEASPTSLHISAADEGYALLSFNGFKGVAVVRFDANTGQIRWTQKKLAIGRAPKLPISMLIDAAGDPSGAGERRKLFQNRPIPPGETGALGWRADLGANLLWTQ